MTEKKRRFAVFTAISLLFIALMFGFFWSMGLLDGDGPSITLPDDGSGNQPGVPQSDPHLTVQAEHYAPLVVTSDNVLSVVATLRRPHTYQYEAQVTMSAGGKSAVFRALCYNKNGYAKTEFLNDQGMPESHVLAGPEATLSWQAGDTRVFSGPAGGISEDDSRRIPTYEDLLSLPKEEICAGEAVTLDEESCIYATWIDPVTDEEQRYWISVASGLLVRAETVNKAGDTVLSMELSGLLYTVDDEVFRLPDGSLAWD